MGVVHTRGGTLGAVHTGSGAHWGWCALGVVHAGSGADWEWWVPRVVEGSRGGAREVQGGQGGSSWVEGCRDPLICKWKHAPNIMSTNAASKKENISKRPGTTPPV